MDSLISIITPLYNSEKYISDTIDSVLSQTYQNWELIIIDDGSNDRSPDVVKEYVERDSRIYFNTRNRLPKGGNACRNIGIEHSKGDYMIFLDSDDLLYPNCLENRLKKIEEHNESDFLVFQMDVFSPTGKIEGKYLTHWSDNYLYSYLSYEIPWQTTCPIWKSDFVKKEMNGFDERFLRLQDPEFHTRALLKDSVKYKVFADLEFLDCSYRVDYKKGNMGNFLITANLYFNIYSEKVRSREDYHTCIEALSKFYDKIFSHYTGSSIEEPLFNIKNIKQINKSAFKCKIITYKAYKKSAVFLFCIENKLFNNRRFISMLNKLGFDHFYSFRIE